VHCEVPPVAATEVYQPAAKQVDVQVAVLHAV